jgi:hypothetical protein
MSAPNIHTVHTYIHTYIVRKKEVAIKDRQKTAFGKYIGRYEHIGMYS